MSSGKVHTRACLMLAAGFTVGALVNQSATDFQYVAGALTGIIVSPDCDVDSKFIAYKYIKQKIGGWAEFAWSLLWSPYRKSIKHGSPFSHFPGVGTFGRLEYLFIALILIPSAVIHVNSLEVFLVEIQWWLSWMVEHWRVWVGLAGADLIHWGLDILTTEHKR